MVRVMKRMRVTTRLGGGGGEGTPVEKVMMTMDEVIRSATINNHPTTTSVYNHDNRHRNWVEHSSNGSVSA